MERINGIAILALSMLLAQVVPAAAAADMYHPYQSYDDYYKTHSVTPPPTPQPPQPPSDTGVEPKPKPRPDQPIALMEAPEFLFPSPLGFGVAVAIPYDLFYQSKSFYLLKDGVWYRALSYRGPWMPVPITRVPPEMRKTGLAKIRKLRNQEFSKYFKDKSHYQGKVFRPTDEIPPPPKTKGK